MDSEEYRNFCHVAVDDDIVALCFSYDPIVDSEEVQPGVILHYNETDDIVCIEVLRHRLPESKRCE